MLFRSVLKRKWLKKDITIDVYLDAVHHLTVDAWGEAIEIQDFGLTDPFLQQELNAIVSEDNIDVSDALLLLTILNGPHSGLVGRSSSVLITADDGLEKAALKRNIRVWNCRTDVPEWA